MQSCGCRRGPALRPRGGEARWLRRAAARLPGHGRRAREPGAGARRLAGRWGEAGRLGSSHRAAVSPVPRGETAGGQVCTLTGAAGTHAVPRPQAGGMALRARVRPPCRDELADGRSREAPSGRASALGAERSLSEFGEPLPGRGSGRHREPGRARLRPARSSRSGR